MRVAHTVPLDLNLPGGVEKHILCLTHALRQLGIHVDVFGQTPPASAASHSDDFRPLQQFNHKCYDIIHTHSAFYNPRYWALQMTRSSHQRHVHTLHAISLDYLLACRAWLNWRCYWCTFVEAMWTHYADHIIAVSDSTRNWARKYFAASPQRISVIPNGYTPSNPTPGARTRIRSALSLTPDHLAVIFVGRCYDRVKGAAAITAAMNQLYPSFPRLRLIAMPGDGFDPAPWLITTGPVPHSQTPDYYAAADIFVSPSLSEGMPLTVIEAMAASLPVVAAPVGGIPDLITHNQSGLLTQPDRSDLPQLLTHLITDPNLRHRLAQEAHSAVAHLTWQNIAKKTATCYESVL